MSWTDEYREIVEFYFWEPQHIGRSAGGKRFTSADEMYAHINELEVSLNHVLNIFFSLFPLHRVDCFQADESHRMLSAWQLETYARQQKNATQPDLFFVGRSSNIAVELKTKSKGSLEQLVKYIKFNKAIAKEDAAPLTVFFLTPHTGIENVFKEKYISLVEVEEAVRATGQPVPRIEALSYDDFYTSLRTLRAEGETEGRLVEGLLTYLTARSAGLNIHSNQR